MENDRIKKVSRYFNEMKVGRTQGGGSFIAVEMQFPANWVIVDNLKEKFGVDAYPHNGLTYFSTSLDNGFDLLFDAIDYNIEKMKAAEERKRLLEEKSKELVSLFSDEYNSLDRLKKLVFATEWINENGMKELIRFDEECINPAPLKTYETDKAIPESNMMTTTLIHNGDTPPTTFSDSNVQEAIDYETDDYYETDGYATEEKINENKEQR